MNKAIDNSRIFFFRLVVIFISILYSCLGFHPVRTSVKAFSTVNIFGSHHSSNNKNESFLKKVEKSNDSDDRNLKDLLEALPENEKYDLLLQSYKTKILTKAESLSSSSNYMEKMENVYYEMLKSKIKPDVKSSAALIDAAASTCSTKYMANAMRLLKLNLVTKGFGVAIGMLTKPKVEKVINLYKHLHCRYNLHSTFHL